MNALALRFNAGASAGGGRGIFPWPIGAQAPFGPPPITPGVGERGDERPPGAGIVWAGGTFRRDVPPEFNARIAAGPSRRVRMGNFGNVRVPGLPHKNGTGGTADAQHPDGQIVMPGVDVFKFDWNTERAEIRKILTATQRHGWTLQVSIGDSQRICDGHGTVLYPAWRQGDVIEYMQMATEEYGFLCDSWLLNGGGSPERDGGPPNPFALRDAQWADYAPVLTPWIDAMQRAGVMPHFTYGWQVDQNNRPVYYHQIEIAIRGLVDAEAPAARHTVNDAVTMFDNKDLQPEPTTETLWGVVDRYTCAKFDSGLRVVDGQWVPAARCKVDLYLLQVSTEGSVDNVQRAMRALMDSCQPNQGANLCEDATQDEFDTPDTRTPVMAAARGLYGSNVIGPRGADDPSQIPYGTYNGRWQEDGRFCS